MNVRWKSFLSRHPAARRALRAVVCVALVLTVLIALCLLALKPSGTQTYLILGMDNYGSLNEIGRSDVMLLVQLGFDRGQIHVVPFARDILLPDENGKNHKINTVVRQRGEDALVAMLEQTFGLAIDGWFRVNFSSVISIIDAMDGVSVALTREEANYIDRVAGAYPDHPLAEGVCHLNGAQALTYARCRKLDNDIGRGARQSKLMEALIQAARGMRPHHIWALYQAMQHAWRSSLSGGEQAALVSRALWLRGASVARVGVPFEGHWRYRTGSNGESNIAINIAENRRLLREALGLPAEEAVP